MDLYLEWIGSELDVEGSVGDEDDREHAGVVEAQHLRVVRQTVSNLPQLHVKRL